MVIAPAEHVGVGIGIGIGIGIEIDPSKARSPFGCVPPRTGMPSDAIFAFLPIPILASAIRDFLLAVRNATGYIFL